MNYIKAIEEKNGKVLRLQDIVDDNKAVQEDLVNFFEIISSSEFPFVQVVQNKGYELVVREKGSIYIVNLHFEKEIEKYLKCDGVINHFQDKGSLYVHNYKAEEKQQDIVVNFGFNPSHKGIMNRSFKVIFQKYFENMVVDCYAKRDGRYLNGCGGDYRELKESLDDTDEIFVRKISICGD